ncbi:MAG: diguanylate cyclase [Clostridiales bacterium]|nr:diguanylate cyclase [Clostridiales bacterium]
MKSGKRFTIDKKMHLFVAATVLFAVACVCALAFLINVDQIDTYYKRLTVNCAETYSHYVDADFLMRLRDVVSTDEYQAIRVRAEEDDDEDIIIEYLREKDLWDGYVTQREHMRKFQDSMQDVRYIYLIAWGGEGEHYDMYLIDADDVPVYETGYFEEREKEFDGTDPNKMTDPVISNGDWGWLCSAYAPVYDRYGHLVCHVGCDVGMEDVMSDRFSILASMIISSLICTGFVLAGAIIFVNRNVISPLNDLTEGIKKFSPGVGKSYKEAGVIDLDIRSNDEIRDIYTEIRSMQTKIIDYIGDITIITRDKEKAENDIRDMDKELGKISIEAYRDSLTGVGNKTAYYRKVDELNEELRTGQPDFAIVMMDINRLKMINDEYGHSAGDAYIMGCCHLICEIFKHSPVFRIGGDEFVAVLTGDDYIERNTRLSELREQFEKTYSRTDTDPWLRYSVSSGMAECGRGDRTVESVFKRADKCMYDDKMRFKESNGLTDTARD